ncbi:MAG: hypothetical protein A3J97_11340 [Spirochaetes bacterium RIFOXYC1_FULL_54_7]|nr:MAG: hypothetical protein A3J97_11340 [Spirochaetes bacterium RIFOXYC1_FULL_54_7]
MSRSIRLFIVCFFLLVASNNVSLSANPFLAGNSPIVRQPSSGGVLPTFQMELRNNTAKAIQSFTQDPTLEGLLLLITATFLYGILHAAGPGHRKTVVFSLFLGRKARTWEPLLAGFLAAGVHGAAGLVIIAILSILRGTVAGLGQAEAVGAFMDAATFVVIGLLAVVLIIRKIVFLQKYSNTTGIPEQNRDLYSLVAIASIVPCPGAIMLLLFASYAGQLWLGILGVVSMSLGMGIVISLAGYLAFAGREGLFHRLKAKEQLIRNIASGFELLSYLLLFGISVYALLPLLHSLF